jgi:hypothetical protein
MQRSGERTGKHVWWYLSNERCCFGKSRIKFCSYLIIFTFSQLPSIPSFVFFCWSNSIRLFPIQSFTVQLTRVTHHQKDFWDHEWNKSFQCQVSFHGFIDKPSHSTKMDLIRWYWITPNASFNQFKVLKILLLPKFSSRWNSSLLFLHEFLCHHFLSLLFLHEFFAMPSLLYIWHLI